MSQVWKRRLSFFITLTFVMSLLTVFTSNTVSAGSWPISVDEKVKATKVITGPTGNVSVIECGFTSNAVNDSPIAKTYDANGNLLATENNIGSDYLYLCDQTGRVHAAAGGSLFGVWGGASQNYLVRSKNSVLAWQASLLLPCTNGSKGWPNSWADGSDGNIYLILQGSCGSTDSFFLAGFNPTTGQDLFPRVRLNGGYSTFYGGLAAYSGGLIVKENNLFRYFNYSSIEDVSKRYTAQPGYIGIRPESWQVNANGQLFINVNTNQGNTLGCSKDYVSTSVIRRDLNGSTFTYNTLPYCVYQPNLTAVTPSGGALLEGDTQNLNQASRPLLILNGDGTIINKPLALDGYDEVKYYQVQTDMYGNLVVTRTVRKYGGDSDTHAQILLLGSDGALKASYSTEYLGINGQQDRYVPTMSTYGSSLWQGSIYLDVWRSQYTAPSELYKIAFKEAAIDYPRGNLYGIQPPVVQTLNYVALGDSFSSGEGVPPFLEGTDVPPGSGGSVVNLCHRSKFAYASLLDKNASVSLKLTKFAACSGATTENIITSGQYSEVRQLDAVGSDTDVVTISIGGNDVNFKDVAIACNTDSATNDCVAKLQNSYNIASSHDFRVKIQSVIAQVKAKASKPSARIIIIGYPNILSTPGASVWCGWAFQSASQQERLLVESLVGELNSASSLAASSLGLEFIDPRDNFNGHAACAPQPYVNGAVLNNQSYSYHPNQAGQQVYAELISGQLG